MVAGGTHAALAHSFRYETLEGLVVARLVLVQQLRSGLLLEAADKMVREDSPTFETA